MSKTRLIFTALSFIVILFLYAFLYKVLQSPFEIDDKAVNTDSFDQVSVLDQILPVNYCETADDCVEAIPHCLDNKCVAE